MDTKPCTQCQEVKPLTEFSPNRNLKTGVQSACKACLAKKRRQKYAGNPKPIREYNRAAAKEKNRELWFYRTHYPQHQQTRPWNKPIWTHGPTPPDRDIPTSPYTP